MSEDNFQEPSYTQLDTASVQPRNRKRDRKTESLLLVGKHKIRAAKRLH